jgi:hypothetical protein
MNDECKPKVQNIYLRIESRLEGGVNRANLKIYKVNHNYKSG